MGQLFALISHKGGTGRTTAAANIGFRIAIEAKRVCCVDLDLTSPTFGAVLGLAGYEHGAPVGMHDFLAPLAKGNPILAAREARDSPPLLDVWECNPWLGKTLTTRPGDFKLLPGKNDQEQKARIVGPKEQGRRLADVFDVLLAEFDVVLADIRSGTSDVVEGMLHAVRDHHCPLASWLVFFRWTPQHLVGAEDLCLRLSDKGAPVNTVRTAFTERDELLEKPPWYLRQHDRLSEQMDERLRGFAPIADIPFEDLLRWQECVVTDDLVAGKRAAASASTVDGYRRLARRILGVDGALR